MPKDLRARALLVAIALTFLPGRASAESNESPGEVKADDKAPVAGSIEGVGAALLPGFIVHGTGLWVRGDKRGARNLATIEASGLVMAAVFGGLLGATGASRRIANQSIPFLVTGTGLFIQSWLADIYGSAGGGRRNVAPRMATPPVSLEVGGMYVRDPQFEYGPFSRTKATVQLGHFRLEPELIIGLDESNQRFALAAAYGLMGPHSRRPTKDATALELALAGRSHRYGREDFTATSAELSVRGRIAAERFGRSLAGSFADLELGFGLEATTFDMSTDLNDQLIIRFGYGLYIGRPESTVRGEVSFFYDHRRDDFPGGISPGDIGGGFLGFFGLEADLDIGKRFGVAGRIEAGSALVFSLGLKARFGEVAP